MIDALTPTVTPKKGSGDVINGEGHMPNPTKHYIRNRIEHRTRRPRRCDSQVGTTFEIKRFATRRYSNSPLSDYLSSVCSTPTNASRRETL